MTGYGQAESEVERFQCKVEMKSLNSKFFELNLRMPRNMQHKETELRRELQKMFETLGNRNRENYHRLMPTLIHSSPEMDETSPKNIQNLIQDGLTFITNNQEELDKIVKKIIRNK